MISKIKYGYLLVFIAVTWIFLFSFLIQLKAGFSPLGDDATYLAAAKKLYLNCKVDDARPMLIAAVHGLPLLFGLSDDVVISWGITMNFCWWILSVLLVFNIVSMHLNRKAGFFSALAFIFCIGNLANAFNFLSEPLYIFMLLASLYFLSMFEKWKRPKYLAWALAILMLAALVKPVAIALSGILALVYLRRIKDIFKTWHVFFPLFAGSMILLQLVSVKKEYGDYTLSYIDSITYYNYLGARADCYRKDTIFFPGKNARAKQFYKFTSHEQRKVANADMKEQLHNNTFNLAKAYLVNIHSNTSKGSYIVSQVKNEKQTVYFDVFLFVFKAISKLQNIIFTAVGVLLSAYLMIRWRTSSRFELLLAALVLFIFFISAISCFECDRFHIVFFPIVIILCAFAVVKFLKNRASPTL